MIRMTYRAGAPSATNQRPLKKKYNNVQRDDVQKMQKTEIKPIKKIYSQREKMCFSKI